MSLESLKEEAVNLSPSERALLIDTLWQSLATPDEMARETTWAHEVESRIEAADSGQLPTIDGPSALRQARQSLRK